MTHEIEEIPDVDSLFLRIHKCYIDNRNSDKKLKVTPAAFTPKPKETCGLSTNWSKYSSAELTQQEVKNQKKDPFNYGVVSLVTSKIRAITPLTVNHAPSANNKAHSEINNVCNPNKKNDLKARLELRDIFKWEIEVESE